MRKGNIGENGGRKRKRLIRIVELRHCQQSTTRTPTGGTPHARANKWESKREEMERKGKKKAMGKRDQSNGKNTKVKAKE